MNIIFHETISMVDVIPPCTKSTEELVALINQTIIDILELRTNNPYDNINWLIEYIDSSFDDVSNLNLFKPNLHAKEFVPIFPKTHLNPFAKEFFPWYLYFPLNPVAKEFIPWHFL